MTTTKIYKYAAAVVFAAMMIVPTIAFAQIGTVITVAGNVLDEVTRNPVMVNVVFSDETGTRAGSSRSNSKDGSYLVTGLKPGKKIQSTPRAI